MVSYTCTFTDRQRTVHMHRPIGNADKMFKGATFLTDADNVIQITIYEYEFHCKISNRDFGNPIATDTVNAQLQINLFHTIRFIRTMRTCAHLPLGFHNFFLRAPFVLP